MIVLIVRLLHAGARFLEALTKLIAVGAVAFAGIRDVDLSVLKRWWPNAPQKQAQPQQDPSPLSVEADAIHQQIQQLMENQFQIDALKRYVLTLPADPDEGY